MSLSFIQASVMSGKMAISAEMAKPGSNGCHSCDGDDYGGADTGTCTAVCGPAAQGLMSGELLTLPSASRTGFQVARLLLSGQFHSPDHGPPKILTLG
jgi:hypothetical protein